MQENIKFLIPMIELLIQKSIKVVNWQPIFRGFSTKRRVVPTLKGIKMVRSPTQLTVETLQNTQLAELTPLWEHQVAIFTHLTPNLHRINKPFQMLLQKLLENTMSGNLKKMLCIECHINSQVETVE